MPAGRPKKYNNVNIMENKINEYFSKCDEDKRPYTMSGLALALDMDRRSLLNYSKDEQFFPTIKKAKRKVEQQLEECLYRLGNNSGVIFNLKNNFEWEDKQELDHSINQKDMNAVNDIASQMESVSEDDIDVST